MNLVNVFFLGFLCSSHSRHSLHFGIPSPNAVLCLHVSADYLVQCNATGADSVNITDARGKVLKTAKANVTSLTVSVSVKISVGSKDENDFEYLCKARYSTKGYAEKSLKISRCSCNSKTLR